MKRYMILAAILLLAGCGARGSAGVAHFARGVGLATANDLAEASSRVFDLHQFEIEREEEAPNIYKETRWRARTPFDDEQALGVTAAQVRAIMRARPRSTTSALGSVYTVDLTVEQRVQTLTSDEWVSITVTPAARAYAERIAADLRRELDVGVRRF